MCAVDRRPRDHDDQRLCGHRTRFSRPTATTAAAAKSITSAVTGTFTNADGTGTFNGTFTPTSFSVVNGVLEATGPLKGTLTDADGTSLGSVSQTATLPVQTTATSTAAHPAVAACNVLNLVLGPLNLNLLGLVVTLNEVHLNITAVPGSLLGDLPCYGSGQLPSLGQHAGHHRSTRIPLLGVSS